MANEDYKSDQIVEIVREFDNTGNKYEVNGLELNKMIPFWRKDKGKFYALAKGQYKYQEESSNTYLVIQDETILGQATEFQLVYIYSQDSSKYIEDFPDLAILVDKYNQLVDDTTKLFTYLKNTGIKADTLKMTKVLVQLEPFTVLYMNDSGELEALPVSELYEKFGNLIKAMEKVLDEYIEQKKEEIRGPAGAIDNVTASVNSNAGTPKVTVSLGGTPERRKIDLKFENLKGDKPIKGTDYYTEQEKEQFTIETLSLVTAEGTKQTSLVTAEGNKQIILTQAEALKVIEQLKSLVAGNPTTTNALTLSGKARIEFEQDIDTGIKKINQNVVWKIGGLNRDGSINNNQKNRAYTDLILHSHKSQTITAPEGFLISIVFYNELSNVTEAFNPVPTQQVKENSRFKIGIRRKSEISNENWDTNSLPFPKDFLNGYVNYSLKTQVLEKIENNTNAIKDLNNNPAINIPYEYYGKTNIGFNYDTIESVKFVSDIESTVNISSATIADIDNISDVKYSNIDVLKQIDGSYKFTLNNPSTNVYQNRIAGKLNNLVIGAKYKIVLKLKSTLEKNRFVQIGIGNKTYKTLSGYNEKENAYIFDYESISNTSEIAIYPFLLNDEYTPTTGEKIEIYDFYITRVFDGIDEFKHFNTVYKNSVSITVNKETIADGFGGMICESTKNIDVYSKIKRSKIIMINNEFPDKNGNINIKKSHLDGKVCVCIGDSITHKGHSGGYDYVSKLEKNTGIECHNFGFGGCQMHVRGNANWDAFSMVGLADAITSGDWSAQERASSDNKFEIYDYAATKTAWAKAFDWSKVDYITVAFGANDISTDPKASIIDNPENPYDKSTYLGAFRYSYEKIMSVYPNIRFLILTPIFRWWIITGEYINSDNRIFANGHHYRDWGDALIEECKKYHIPYLNMYDDAGINDHNRLYYFDKTDGTHPNEKGLELMGDILTGSILSRY